MFKRIISILCTTTIFLSISLNTFAATVINQDVELIAPLANPMEDQQTADAISYQIDTEGGSAVLTQDCVEGSYAIEATLGNSQSNNYVTFTLADSSNFDIDKYSIVTLWIKPCEGASFIEFYTNNSKILNDSNNNGTHFVGKDLTAGKWNEITLDLTKTEGDITTGQDLSVKTNDNSHWVFDSINTLTTPVTEIDLSKMTNDKTQIEEGILKFRKTPEGNYDTTPTILMSNPYPYFEKNYTNYQDFITGTLDSCQVNTDGTIQFNHTEDKCLSGTPISGGYYSYDQTRAFDDNEGTYWQSSQSDTSIMGNAYIGYEFQEEKAIACIKIKQYNHVDYAVKSAKLQYYDEQKQIWQDLQTLSLDINIGWQSIQITPILSAKQWRILANANTASSRWRVYELQMLEYGSYTAPIENISNIKEVKKSSISWNNSQDSKLLVSTRLSFDNGQTWQPWSQSLNGYPIPGINQGMDLTSTLLQYKVTVKDSTLVPMLLDVSISIINNNNTQLFNLKGNSIKKISIQSDYYNKINSEISLPTYSPLPINPTAFSLSGDGSTIYYLNTLDGSKLYKYTIKTGQIEKISDIGNIEQLKANYDGTKIAYNVTSSYNNGLYLYNKELSIIDKNIDGDVENFVMQKDGSVIYWESDGDDAIYLADPSGVAQYIGAQNGYYYPIGTPFSGNTIYYATGWNIYKATKDPKGWQTNEIYIGSGNISSLFSNPEGTMLYFKISDDIYSLNLSMKAARKLNIPAGTNILKVIKEDKLILQDSEYNYYEYNPISDQPENIRPADAINPPEPTTFYFDMDQEGNKMIYRTTNDLRLWHKNQVEVEKYLLSFDNKNSWYSYKDGRFYQVTSTTPSPQDLISYGMTKEEINSLTPSDFSTLYQEGKEIYNLDIALYLTSLDNLVTPGIKSIKIITNKGDYETTPAIGTSLYTAKKQDFEGSDYRKIYKIYPVEISPKESQYYYYIYADNKYQYYKDNQWQEETDGEIGQLLEDVEANWIEITKTAMSLDEISNIPQETLTQKLGGKQFSIIYPMKVKDSSTKQYKSNIIIDYTKDLFTSSSLAISILLTDGTQKQFTGLSDTQIEDIMEWLNKRQYNQGSIFYTIQTGTQHYFLNYYTIQSITVEEL